MKWESFDAPLFYDGKWIPMNPWKGIFYFKLNSGPIMESRLHELDYHQDTHESHRTSP